MLEAIARHRVTIGFGPPEMFLSLATCPGLERLDLGSFRRVLLSGSPLREPQLEQIERGLGLSTLFLAFGMTELTGGVAVAPWRGEDGRARVHAGRPLASIEVGFFDGDHRLEAGGSHGSQEGEIGFRGPHRMAGYLGAPPLEPDAWLRSGDLGFVDEDGLLHVTGRIKEVIIKAGENISIAEVEQVVLSCPSVREVCIVGVPDARLGENVAAAVVARDPSFGKRALQQFCLGKLQKPRIPQKVLVVDELPKLANGKVDRRAVRQLLADAGLARE